MFLNLRRAIVHVFYATLEYAACVFDDDNSQRIEDPKDLRAGKGRLFDRVKDVRLDFPVEQILEPPLELANRR